MHLDTGQPSRTRVFVPIVAFAAISAALYLFGTNHTPDYSGTGLFGRTAQNTLGLKSWLATAILALALFQLVSALWMFGRLPCAPAPPPRLPTIHRLSGAALLLITLPVAYHCTFAYGVQTFDARVAVHSLAGCFLYGAFVAKIIVVRSERLPRWALPLAGGTLVTVVAVLWYTAALWHFNGSSL